MAKGRPADPKRTKRGTGHRPAAGRARPTIVPTLVAVGPPPAPEDMPAAARDVWQVIVAELDTRGLKAADFEALRMMCNQAARARDAAAKIAQYGMLVEGPRGPMVNPMVRVERDATMMYLRLAEQYGATLASRLRLGLMQLAGESMLGMLNADLDAGI